MAIGITPADIERYGIEYVVAGAHWPKYDPIEREAIIRSYHRQNMFLVTHPLVDIVAHPWWWAGAWKDADGRYTAEPWLDDFGRIPASMHEEFASAAIEHGKVVEINLDAMLLTSAYPEAFKRQYLDYLSNLNQRSVKLSIGSDCHDEHYDVDFEKAASMLESVGIQNEDLWRLPPKPS
jgi:histidinol phosphatase-like PHP family hydrolase